MSLGCKIKPDFSLETFVLIKICSLFCGRTEEFHFCVLVTHGSVSQLVNKSRNLPVDFLLHSFTAAESFSVIS